MRQFSVAGWGLLLCLSLCGPAQAHLMGRGHGTLNVVKDKVYVVLSISVAAFSQSDARDAVADGVLTAAELKAHSETLRKAIRAGFTLRQGERLAPFTSILLNLPKGSHHALGRSTELTVMMVAPLPDKQAGHAFIAVQNTLWDPAESRLKLKATITVAGKISHREIIGLTPKQNRHRFFCTVDSRPRKGTD